MTTIQLEEKNGYIFIEATGHSGYASIGLDIVCAGITALLMAFNDYTEDKTVLREIRSGGYKVKCKADMETKVALEMLISGLMYIQENYPENLTVKNFINDTGGRKNE